MTVEITIRNDAGEVVMHHSADAMRPTQWKSPYERPISDGTYKLFAVTYQPTVVVIPKSNR